MTGEQALIVGGTGTLGRWLLAGGLGRPAVVLTRDPARAADRLRGWCVVPSLLAGESKSFVFPGGVTHLVFVAGRPCHSGYDAEEAAEYVASVRHAWEAARAAGVVRSVLVSSGAVYGPHESPVDEDAPQYEPIEPARRLYAAARRDAEQVALESGVPTTVARVFAVLGPGMPPDGPLAAGQFLAAGLAGRPIHVRNGRAVRSYLDRADFAHWLVAILDRGTPGRAYNVGSETPVTLGDLGRAIAVACGVDCRVDDPDRWGSDHYLPATRRARDELGLTETVSLSESIRRAVDWHRNRA